MGDSPSPRAPKVAYVLTRYPVLSETFVRLEVDELRRQGLPVLVVSLYEGEPASPDALYLYGQHRPRWRLALAHVVWLLRSPRRYRSFWRAVAAAGEERGEVFARHLPWAATQLRKAGVEVLHAHFAWSSAARAHALATLLGLPWSMTVHAHDMFGRDYRLREKLEAASAVVTVCHYNEQHLRSDFGFAGPVDLVVCGVELPPDVPERRGDIDILAVGRLVEKKGFDLLIGAVARMSTREVRVQVIGEGPERPALEAQIRELGLASRVELLGAMSHAEVLDRMSRARLLCLPARVARDGDRDSMPLVVKEAMAREVPVVATSVVGIPEMLDASCGWLVPGDDVAALAEALDEALRDPAEARRRGQSARQRVVREFQLSDEVRKLRQVFARMVTP